MATSSNYPSMADPLLTRKREQIYFPVFHDAARKGLHRLIERENSNRGSGGPKKQILINLPPFVLLCSD